MNMEELLMSNLQVDQNYKSLHGDNLAPVLGSESIVTYFERSTDFLKTFVSIQNLFKIIRMKRNPQKLFPLPTVIHKLDIQILAILAIP